LCIRVLSGKVGARALGLGLRRRSFDSRRCASLSRLARSARTYITVLVISAATMALSTAALAATEIR
jgi:hypothetical protein